MTEPQPQLDYATAPPLYRRRAVRQAAVTIALLALAVIGYHYLAPFKPRVRAMIIQRRMATITYPPTQVAWEEDPARIAAWTGGAPSGPDWATLNDYGHVLAVYLTPPAFRGAVVIPGVVGNGAAVIYAGTRNAGVGSRMVSIHMVDQPYHLDRRTASSVGNGIFYVMTERPATLTTDIAIRGFPWADPGPFNQIPPGQLRLYWGQSDPADAAHFTIRFESPVTSGTIDCRLLPDDTVKFKVIPNPATAPSR
jgi:hypothetical protein